MSLINCSLCERDLNPFDYAFHLGGDEHQRRLADLTIPIVNFNIDGNPFLTPPPSPYSSFSSIDFSPFSLPESPIEFFPAMSPPSSVSFLSQELIASTPKKPSPPKSPRLNDSMELANPAYPPWHFLNKRLFSSDDDEGPASKRIQLA